MSTKKQKPVGAFGQLGNSAAAVLTAVEASALTVQTLAGSALLEATKDFDERLEESQYESMEGLLQSARNARGLK